jgi:hypothetical protein
MTSGLCGSFRLEPSAYSKVQNLSISILHRAALFKLQTWEKQFIKNVQNPGVCREIVKKEIKSSLAFPSYACPNQNLGTLSN